MHMLRIFVPGAEGKPGDGGKPGLGGKPFNEKMLKKITECVSLPPLLTGKF